MGSPAYASLRPGVTSRSVGRLSIGVGTGPHIGIQRDSIWKHRRRRDFSGWRAGYGTGSIVLSVGSGCCVGSCGRSRARSVLGGTFHPPIVDLELLKSKSYPVHDRLIDGQRLAGDIVNWLSGPYVIARGPVYWTSKNFTGKCLTLPDVGLRTLGAAIRRSRPADNAMPAARPSRSA
jgi:hypothetical protein